MKNLVRCLACIAVFSFLMPAITSAQQDLAGSKDYPMFSRWPGYYIMHYDHKKFDTYTYQLKDRKETVEGEKYYIDYSIKDGAEIAGNLEIIRNYENAIRKAGGTVLYTPEDKDYTIGKIVKEGKEIWVCVDPYQTGRYISLYIVERQSMEQTIQANAASWFSDISTTGHAAVYGIYFDIDKAEMKPESGPALDEMAKLLRTNAALNVFIVGHTDNTGTFEHNMKLSQDRAAAVVSELAGKHGIAATRLRPVGVASLAPVSSNKSDQGRAKNRRVELVER
jgi:outer membrane protein OmpA-like peptidoglycan-associated protein